MTNHVNHMFVSWYSGTLPEKEKAAVDAHLQQCKDCRLYFQEMAAALDSAGEIPGDLTLPQGFPTRIRALAEAKRPPRFSLPAAIRWGIIALAAVASGIALGEITYTYTRSDVIITAFQEEYESLNAQVTLSEAANELGFIAGGNNED